MARQTRPIQKTPPARAVTVTPPQKAPPVVATKPEPGAGRRGSRESSDAAFFARVDDPVFRAEVDAFIEKRNARHGDARMSRASLTRSAIRAYMRSAESKPEG